MLLDTLAIRKDRADGCATPVSIMGAWHPNPTTRREPVVRTRP
jgi:hypothetical protein